MPGCSYYGAEGGNTLPPNIEALYLANNLTGTGTPPAAYVYATDILVRTTKSTLTSNNIPVVRPLIQADITALYQEGGQIVGLLGAAADDFITNSSGVAQAPPTSVGGVVFPGSYASNQYLDPVTGRSQGRVLIFETGQRFLTPLYTGGGSVTLKGQYDGTLAGINISVSNGVSTYTIDPNATTKCVRIIAANTADPNYGKLVAQNAYGPTVIWEVLSTYQQWNNNTNYSTN
jgi:hypothetical protein